MKLQVRSSKGLMAFTMICNGKARTLIADPRTGLGKCESLERWLDSRGGTMPLPSNAPLPSPEPPPEPFDRRRD